MLFDVGDAGEFLGLSVLYDHKGGSLLNAQLLCKIRLLVGIDLGVFHAGLVKRRAGYFAVGAGGGHKKNVAVLYRLIGRSFGYLFRNGLCVLSADNAVVGEGGAADVINLAVLIFLGFAVVPVLNRAVVTGDSAVYFGGLAANWALFLFARQVSVGLADRIGGGHGVVGQLVVFGYLADKICSRLPIGQLFAQECVENGTRGVERLQLVLNVESRENVLGVSHGQVGAVGVVGGVVAALGSGDDAGKALDVVLCETERGGLGGGGLEIIEVAVLLLIVGKTLSHVVEHLDGEVLGLLVGQILSQPFGVEAGLVHAHKTDGGKVVVEGAEITLGIRIKAVVEQLGDDRSLDFKRSCGNVHELVKTVKEILFVLCEIGNSGHIYGHDAHRAGGLAASEKAAGFFAQLAKVETESAAHGANVGGLHVGIDVVGEIGGAVFGGHFKEKLVVLGFRPVEIAGYGIGGNGILEASAVGVALDHDLDEGLVDHVHFLFAVFVFKIHFLAAHDCVELGEVGGNGPVKGDVGEGRLGSPAAGGVDAVDKGLYALLDFLVGKVVDLDKGSKIGVERGKCLSARPFVLHDSEEVDHLIAEGGKVGCGGGGYLSGNSAEPLLNELLKRPAGAVAGQHGKVVNVNVGVSVSVADFVVINLRQPIVGGNRTGVAENEAANRIGDGGIFLNSPVVYLKIVVDYFFIVKQRGAQVSEFFSLLAVKNVGLGHAVVSALDKHRFDAVLNGFDGDFAVGDFLLEIRGDLEGEKIHRVGMIVHFAGVKGLGYGVSDFGKVKIYFLSVSFDNGIHDFSPFCFSYLYPPSFGRKTFAEYEYTFLFFECQGVKHNILWNFLNINSANLHIWYIL